MFCEFSMYNALFLHRLKQAPCKRRYCVVYYTFVHLSCLHLTSYIIWANMCLWWVYTGFILKVLQCWYFIRFIIFLHSNSPFKSKGHEWGWNYPFGQLLVLVLYEQDSVSLATRGDDSYLHKSVFHTLVWSGVDSDFVWVTQSHLNEPAYSQIDLL